MNKKIHFLILLFLLSLSGYSQTKDSLQQSRLTITTSLFSYLPSFDLNVIKYNIGSEFYQKNRVSFYMNFAVLKSYAPSSGWLSTSSKSTNGIKTELEGRYYLNKQKIFQPAILLFWPHIFQFKSQSLSNSGYYVAGNMFYQRTNTIRSEYANLYSSPAMIVYKHDYTVERNVFDLNFRIGFQCIRKCGFTIDYAVGFGGQYISSSSADKLEKNEDSDFFSHKSFDSGSGFAPTVVYQFRIGWAFK